MKTSKLTILELSDIHLGHPNTPFKHIMRNLDRALPFDEIMRQYDLLIIAGDCFDRLFNLPDNNALLSLYWINRLLIWCERYDVILRVLEGTPSHDWKQSMLFPLVAKITNSKADVEYIDTLCIRPIERLGINILYIPDEWKPDPKDIWIDVKKCLNEHQLDKVDFCIMHGNFNYQVPDHYNIPAHDEKAYLSITRYLIFIGHIHQFSRYDRIVSAGSFDRLCHGEEYPKGYIKAIVPKGGPIEVYFKENVGALTYKTIEIKTMEVEKALMECKHSLNQCKQGSHIRFLLDEHHPLIYHLSKIKEDYPHLHLSLKKKEKEKIKDPTVKIKRAVDCVPITKQNIKDEIFKRLPYDYKNEISKERLSKLIHPHL